MSDSQLEWIFKDTARSTELYQVARTSIRFTPQYSSHPRSFFCFSPASLVSYLILKILFQLLIHILIYHHKVLFPEHLHKCSLVGRTICINIDSLLTIYQSKQSEAYTTVIFVITEGLNYDSKLKTLFNRVKVFFLGFLFLSLFMALNHEKIVVLFGLQYHLKVNKYFSGMITYTKRRFNYKVFVMAKERKPIRVRNFNYIIIS